MPFMKSALFEVSYIIACVYKCSFDAFSQKLQRQQLWESKIIQ